MVGKPTMGCWATGASWRMMTLHEIRWMLGPPSLDSVALDPDAMDHDHQAVALDCDFRHVHTKLIIRRWQRLLTLRNSGV